MIFFYCVFFPVCVEFFNEKNQLEKYFAAPSHLHPLSVEFLPEKRTKKYEKCWEAAKSEKEAIDTVIDVRISSSYHRQIVVNLPIKFFTGNSTLDSKQRL